MKQQLREALEAVKQGDEEKARVLLAEFLRDEPDNVPAWVLMSKLATSQGQKAAFLRKILSLDPQHTYAREQLAASGAAQPQIAQPEAEAPPPLVEASEVAEAVDDLEDAESIPQFAEEPESPAEFAPEEFTPEMEDAEEEEALAEESADIFSEEEEDLLPAAEAPAVEPPPMVHTDDAEEAPEVMESEEIGEWAEPPAPAFPEQEEEDAGGIDWDRFLRDEAGVDVFEEEGQGDMAMPVSEDPSDYEAQAEGDTMPPWMDQGETLVDEPSPVGSEQEEGEEEPAEEEIPGWLHEPPDDSWLAEPSEVEKEAAAAKEAEIAAAMAAGPDRTAQAEGANTMLVGILAVLAILVFLALVYAAVVLL